MAINMALGSKVEITLSPELNIYQQHGFSDFLKEET